MSTQVARRRVGEGAIIFLNIFACWPMSIMFDGRHIWVTMYFDAELLRMSLDGTILGRFEMLRGPYDVMFDGQFVWIANLEDNAITRVER